MTTIHYTLAIVAGIGAIYFALRARPARAHRRRVLIALVAAAAGVANAGEAAIAATPADTVYAQFRHATIHRMAEAWDVPPADITGGCLQRRARVWSCGVVVWDPAFGVKGGVVDGTMTFRFTSAAGVAGYSGPSGPRWKTTLPYGRRAHRHLVGVVVRITIGKDRDPA